MSRMTNINPMFQGPVIPGAQVPPTVGPGMAPQMGTCCPPRPQCPTIYKNCPPIVTCSKQCMDQFHITKQPFIHNYHTEVTHHHITETEFIPQFSCSEVHVTHPSRPPFGPMGPGPVGPGPVGTPFGPGPVGTPPFGPGPMF